MHLNIPSKPLHIESISIGIQTGEYFFGTVRNRSIYYYKDGQLKPWIDSNSLESLYAVMGLQISHDNESLWVCTAALPQIEGYSENLKGKSSVFEIDIASKKVITKATIESGSAFGDLIIDKEGTALISDGSGNKIYSIRSGDKELTVLANRINLITRAIRNQSSAFFDF